VDPVLATQGKRDRDFSGVIAVLARVERKEKLKMKWAQPETVVFALRPALMFI
jgi:hypothetical protein